ncbi:MAG: class II aldolase/adducin family protein [Thermodesulfobacteriota bacterium]|nr:class II aldolase/adducin family protein [Thermodesulfobacteriota bacterium]
MEKEIETLKEKLARACRMLEMVGLIDFSGHISARIPGHQTFFIHPATLPRTEVTPGDFIEVGLSERGTEEVKGIPQETPIHTAVYQARQDVNSVIHIHSHYSILPSIAGKDLVPVCHHGSIFGPVVPVYPDSEKITTSEQASQLARTLGGARAVIMKGHGAVVAESSIEAVFVAGLFLEENAKFFVEASILGNPIPLPEEERKRAAANTYQAISIQKNWAYFVEKGRKAGIFWD